MLKKLSWKKMTKSIDFQRGVELFRSYHNLSAKYPEARELNEKEGKKLEDLECFKPVKYSWYKKVVSGEEWKKYKDFGYYVLKENYKMMSKAKKIEQVEFAFLAVIHPKNCLEITNIEELRQIQLPREAVNIYPQPFEKKEL